MKTDFPDTNSAPDQYSGKTIRSKGVAKLMWTMVGPYKRWLLIIFLAMVLETCMNLTTPWPLKIIIDNVISRHPLPHWLSWMDEVFPEENRA